jgi:hypothetical protein
MCLDYAQNFYQQHHIVPTFRAISLANQHNRLLACSEREVKFLLGSKSELEKYLSGENKLVELNNSIISGEIKIELPVSVETATMDEESLLVNKYLTIIKTRQDLLKLSSEERTEIKRVFKSEFRFFSCLQKNN